MNFCINHEEMSSYICKELENGSLFVHHLIDSSISTQFKRCVEEQLGKRLIKPPNIQIHSEYYGGEYPLHIKGLSEVGYQTWYPNIKFSVCIGDNLDIRTVTTEGFESCNFNTAGFSRIFQHKLKQLKTQINHVIRINSVRIPCAVFERVLKEVQTSEIVQPYVANLNIGVRIRRFGLITFDHIVTGERLLCSCHKDAHEQMLDEIGLEISNPSLDQGLYVYGNGNFRDTVIDTLAQGRYEDDLCHLCLARQYSSQFSLRQYGSGIKKKTNDMYNEFAYDPYVDVLMRRDNLDFKTARREVRSQLGISKWTREDELYDLVKNLFVGEKILREASPEWLGQLRFDIYLPRLLLAIEHMGEQHYRPVKLFGGEEGFRRTVERDKLKQKYCEGNGVSLIYVRYNQTLSEANLKRRLNRWLKLI